MIRSKAPVGAHSLAFSSCTRLDTGADSIHPARNHKQRRLDSYRHALADTHPDTVVQPPFPPAVQGYYSNIPRSNTTHIRETLDKALHRAGLLNVPLTRLPQMGNLLIPSSEADAHHPKYWAARISALLTRSAQDAVLDTLQFALKLGCRPFVKGIERTDRGSAHHPGIFLKPSQLNTPWVSRDSLQPHSNPRVTRERREAMLALCAAVDKVANTAVKRHMRRLDEPTYRRHHRVKRLLKIGAATVDSIPEDSAWTTCSISRDGWTRPPSSSDSATSPLASHLPTDNPRSSISTSTTIDSCTPPSSSLDGEAQTGTAPPAEGIFSCPP